MELPNALIRRMTEDTWEPEQVEYGDMISGNTTRANNRLRCFRFTQQ
jgi:hypothetical protein